MISDSLFSSAQIGVVDQSSQIPILTYPYSQDIVYVQAVIGKERKSLDMVEEEISALADPGEEIQRKRADIKERISRLTQLLVPLIPAEILLRIFRIAIGIPESSIFRFDEYQRSIWWFHHRHTLHTEPWFFASVCRVWREVMLSNPILWSYITICEKVFCPRLLDSETLADDAEWISKKKVALHTHLARSADHDLFIAAIVGKNWGDPLTTGTIESESLTPLSEILSQHSHRLRYLNLHHDLADLIHGPFPRLHYLHLNIDSNRIQHGIHCSFRETAAPAHVRIDFLRPMADQEGLSQLFAWEQVSTLGVCGAVDRSQVPVILGMATNLVDLDLHIWADMDPELESLTLITFPKLERLAIGGGKDVWAYLMQLFITSALRYCRINEIPSDDDESMPHLLKLIDRSHCHLSSISISLLYRDIHTLIASLRDVRIAATLRKLGIRLRFHRDHTLYSRLLSSLLSTSIPETKKGIPLRLETIMFEDVKTEEIGPILDVLATRGALDDDGNGLKMVIFGSPDNEWDFDRLMEWALGETGATLRRGGLRILPATRSVGDTCWPDF